MQHISSLSLRAGGVGPIILLGLCLAVSVGCGEDDGIERVPITGQLTVQGQPLGHAAVQFLPTEGSNLPGALGVADENGRFEVISSREGDEGVPPGEYRVRVSRLVDPDGTVVPPTEPDANHPDARQSIPGAYSGPDSPLRVVIPKEGGEVKVDIPEPLNEIK